MKSTLRRREDVKPFKRILASLALALVTALSFAPSAQAQAMSD